MWSKVLDYKVSNLKQRLSRDGDIAKFNATIEKIPCLDRSVTLGYGFVGRSDVKVNTIRKMLDLHGDIAAAISLSNSNQ
jgi:hypothetical protein